MQEPKKERPKSKKKRVVTQHGSQSSKKTSAKRKKTMQSKTTPSTLKGKKKRASHLPKKTSKHFNKKPLLVKTKPVKTAFVLNILFYTFILFMIVGSTFFMLSSDENKSFLGYRFFGVLTDSMVPRDPQTQKGGFRAGDVIAVRNISGEEVEVGDIITFRPNRESNAFLTHRVKEKLDHLGDTQGRYYITQGDANLAEDVPISAEQVVGKKVFVLPKLGTLLNFVRDNLIVTIIFLISVFGFITVIRYYILQ